MSKKKLVLLLLLGSALMLVIRLANTNKSYEDDLAPIEYQAINVNVDSLLAADTQTQHLPQWK